MTGNTYEHKWLPSIQVSNAGGVEVVMGNFQVQPMPHCDLENLLGRFPEFNGTQESRTVFGCLGLDDINGTVGELFFVIEICKTSKLFSNYPSN